jgi:hypothetical protein
METMENTSATKPSRARASKKSSSAQVQDIDAVGAVEEKKAYQPKRFDPDQIVTVYNGFRGRLVYKSRKTGELFVWEDFGDEQDMEVSELKSARNASKKFFVNNWFLFDDPEVVEYLGLKQYYRNSLNLDEFDGLFDLPDTEMQKKIEKLSGGQKKSVAYFAKQEIANGNIDSNKKIAVLEKALGIELIEH